MHGLPLSSATKKLTNMKDYLRDTFKEELSLLMGNSCIIIV